MNGQSVLFEEHRWTERPFCFTLSHVPEMTRISLRIRALSRLGYIEKSFTSYALQCAATMNMNLLDGWRGPLSVVPARQL
jgi:hypothetical protein